MTGLFKGGNEYDIKKETVGCIELYRRNSPSFSLVLKLSSSSFRSKMFTFQVFLIITITDTNLEDLRIVYRFLLPLVFER